MKALLCKTSLLLSAILLAGQLSQAEELKKNVKKEFQTNSSTVLSIDTKFTDLKVTSWDQQKAAFDITIVAEHNDPEKAARMLDLMSVRLEQNGNQIIVVTEIDDKFQKIDWGKTKKMNFMINAQIPASIDLELENNFGSVKISELSGAVSIENNYGSLAIESLSGTETELELNYGDVRLGRVSEASIELNYGNLTIQQADKLDIEVNYGDCDIQEAGDVVAEVNMGDLKIEKVRAGFDLLDLESSTGSIDVGIDKSAGFTLNADMNMGSISTPELDKKEDRKSGMGQSVKGSYGSGKSVIRATGNMGSIRITLR